MSLLFRFFILLFLSCTSFDCTALQSPPFISKPKLDFEENFQALMDSVGKLAIFIRVNQAVYEKCNIRANLTRQEAKADFLAREKLAFQFNDLLIDLELEPKDVMGESFTQLVDEFCASNNSNVGVDMKIRPLVEAQLELMEKLDRSLLLSRQRDKKYPEEHMHRELAQKIENINILPIEEQRQIASAIFRGIYVFAGRNYVENIKDLSSSIISAASEELVDAQEWLGNYFACNAEKQKGIDWLEKADKNGSETAIDSILETKDLGRPTVCNSLLQYYKPKGK